MIVVTRALVRQVRAVLRKSIPRGRGRGLKPRLLVQTGPDGLALWMHTPEVVVAYLRPGPLPAERLFLPAEAIDELAGKETTEITLTGQKGGGVQARWLDGGVPQVKGYPAAAPGFGLAFPELPAERLPLPAEFLQALAAAAEIVRSATSPRYALQHLQLRGGRGQLVATDGKQLLVQGGFAFPFSEDLLIPALPVFGCAELPSDLPVLVGRTKEHLCLEVGPWHFYLTLDRDGRYPAVDQVIPPLTGKLTTCRLAPEDAAFLARVLSRLPADADPEGPVTLELGDRAVVRAHAEGQAPPTELVLTRSRVAGPPVRLVCNRRMLGRTLQLGFDSWRVLSPEQPLVCQDARRTYLFVPLPSRGALPASPQALRLASDDPAPPQPANLSRKRSFPTSLHPPSAVEPVPAQPAAAPASLPASRTQDRPLVDEVQALQDLVQDACGRTHGLVAALKRQRQPSRRLRASLATLRQLQVLGS